MCGAVVDECGVNRAQGLDIALKAVLSAASCRAAADYVLGRVCVSIYLCVIIFKRDISTNNLRIFAKFVAGTRYIHTTLEMMLVPIAFKNAD